MRRESGILQHGTLPLCGNTSRICEALVYPDEASRDEAKEKVLARATTLERALRRRISWEQAADAVVRGFTETFDISFTESVISPAEYQRAKDCMADKFENDEWTHKR